MPSFFSDVLAWVVIAAFVSAALTHRYSPERAQRFAAGSWLLFAAFWLSLIPFFTLEQRSYVEGMLCIIAVPACLYVAYLVYDERPSLLVLTRAVAVMGAIYLPFQTITPIRRTAIETVTVHGHLLIETVGFETAIRSCAGLHEAGYAGVTCLNPYDSMFLTTSTAGGPYVTPVLLACTGIGSIAIVVGLVLAVQGTIRQKATGVAIAVPIIYGLNVIRVAFIVLAHANQWFRVSPLTELVMFPFGTNDPLLVSYYVSDRVIAQSLSVVAFVVIGWGLIRVVPSLSVVLDEIGYLLTGEDQGISEKFV